MSLSSLVPAFRMSSTWLPDWSTTNVLGVATVAPAGGVNPCWNKQPEKTAAPLTALAAGEGARPARLAGRGRPVNVPRHRMRARIVGPGTSRHRHLLRADLDVDRQ